MIFLFLISVNVFQRGDTLIFKENDEIVEIMVLTSQQTDVSPERLVIEQAKVSSDNRKYFVYETVRDANRDSVLHAKLTVFDARKNRIFEEETAGFRNLSYELSSLHDSLFVVATWDHFYCNPSLTVIKGEEKIDVIKEGQWQRIVSYKVSPHNQYMLFHARKPYRNKLWDYIYFYNLRSGESWDYMFPTCLSCKKARIDLNVYDDGRSEVIHKREHRIFSKDGALEDIFLKLQ